MVTPPDTTFHLRGMTIYFYLLVIGPPTDNL